MRSLGVRSHWFSCVFLTAFAVAGLAHAQDADGYQGGYYDEPPAKLSNLTLTISPFHLFIPMLVLQAEVRAGDYLGFAVIGGGGRLDAQTSDKKVLHFNAYQAGVQVVAYPFEPFQKMQLGIEALWLHVTVDPVTLGARRVTGLGAGLTVGPFIGYKWISEPGFSVFIQGGFKVLVSQAHAKNDLGQSATVHENDLVLLLNMDIGWSF
jgi:hypothetical protein